jgi:hypothetical protein
MARKRRTKAEILAAKSEGLGDTVEKVLEVTGISKVAKWLLGEDCGCEGRKQKLNQLFRYKTPKCLEENEYAYLDEFFNKKKELVSPIEQKVLLSIHSRIFNVRNEPTSCASCLVGKVNELKTVYNEYKDEQNG